MLLPIAVYTMLEQNREAVGEINYTTFQSHLERDNISEVTITNQKAVEGQFKRPVTIDNRQVELSDRQRLESAYASRLVDGRYPVTYEVVYGTAFGPPEGQPRRTRDGDVATISVDSLLKSRTVR